MTVEELEILITAKTEEAVKEIEKIMPTIKQMVKQAQETFQKMDTKTMQNKLQQAVQFAKKKVQELKKSTEKNEIAIKVTNDDARNQVTQLEKEIDSLQKKISGRELKLNITNDALDKIRYDTNQKVVKEMPDAGAKRIGQQTELRLYNNDNYMSLVKQSDKLNNEIIRYNALLDGAKSKMAQLGQETQRTGATQSKLSSFFSAFKQKLEQAKPIFSKMGGALSGIAGIFSNLGNKVGKVFNVIKQKASGIGGSFKGGLKHVLKYAGALLSIRGIYGLLRGTANAWLSSQNAGAKQLSANIDYMKYAMGSALAPVIQFVTNLVYQLMKAIQSVVYALFRVNIFAKASAKSYTSMAGSAKKAKEETKQLAGVHDEINNIQDNKNSDSGSSTTAPNVDLSGIDNKMSPLAQKFYDFFKPLKESWDTYGQTVVEAFKNAFNGLGTAVSAMWSSVESIFTNGTIYSIIANILNSIGQIGEAWANAWNNDNNGTEIIQGIADMINDITNAILNLVSSTGFQTFLDGILSAFSGIVQFLEPIVSGFSEMAGIIIEIAMSAIGELLKTVGDALQAIGQNEMARDILKAIGEAIAIVVAGIIAWNVAQLVLNGLMTLFSILTSPITLIILGIIAAITAIILIIKNWGAISEWFGSLWSSICDFISGIWNGIKDTAVSIFNGIKNTISKVFNAIKDFIVNIWNGIVDTISNVWNTIVTKVKEGVQGAWNAITSVFGGIANWFGNIFKGAWEAVKNVFSAGGKIFDGIKDGILNGLKSIVNAIIGGINKVIAIPFNGLNSALRAIKNVNIMGLQPFSWINTIGVPQIPKLAKGGVLTEATAVIAGEYSGAKSNPEIVTPQNILRDTFEDVLSNYSGNNNDRPIYLTVMVGNKKLGQILLDDLRDRKRQTGKDIEALVGT